MMRAFLFSFGALILLGCGGSEPQPETPASAGVDSAASPERNDSPQPVATPAATNSTEDNWEGEDAAKKAAADGGGKPAPPDTKKEETRTTEVIAKIIKDNRQPVRDCYDKAQKELPSLKGDLVIFFILDPEGKIKKIELNQQASTLKAPAVVDCAIKVIKGLNFPPSSRGMETTVNYPYNFNPK
jgi:hypothetical protein